MPLADIGPDFLNRVEDALPGCLAEAPEAMREEPRGLFHGRPGPMARPRATAEVATLMALANDAAVPVVPYAGGTGLVGGQVMPDGPVPLVLSMERMNTIRDISTGDRSLVAEAGVILADIHQAVAADGLVFPLSLASEGSCRIGGNLATNAGGVNVIRYGNARDLCLGVEAVMANGSVLNGLKSLRKDNTGYDLRHLLIGSEGTLGIITAARLRLFTDPAEKATAFLAVRDPAAALSLLHRVVDAFGEQVSAFELIDATGLGFVERHMPQVSQPKLGGGRWFVLTEIGAGAGSDLDARFEPVLEAGMDAGLVTDGTLAQSEAQRDALWAMREAIPEGNRLVGAIASHDISVPIGAVPDFITQAHAAIAAVDTRLRINCFGHLGDGNLHFNIFPEHDGTRKDWMHLSGPVKDAVYTTVSRFDGSISAEHGIGRLRVEEFERYGDPTKAALMRSIKAALDPKGILNPGVYVPI